MAFAKALNLIVLLSTLTQNFGLCPNGEPLGCITSVHNVRAVYEAVWSMVGTAHSYLANRSVIVRIFYYVSDEWLNFGKSMAAMCMAALGVRGSWGAQGLSLGLCNTQ